MIQLLDKCNSYNSTTVHIARVKVVSKIKDNKIAASKQHFQPDLRKKPNTYIQFSICLKVSF